MALARKVAEHRRKLLDPAPHQPDRHDEHDDRANNGAERDGSIKQRHAVNFTSGGAEQLDRTSLGRR